VFYFFSYFLFFLWCWEKEQLVVALLLGRVTTATELVVAPAVVARGVCLAVEVLLTRNLLALARVRVAVRARERIGVILVALVAPACVARVLTPLAEADAVVRPLVTRTAHTADTGVVLHTATGAEAFATVVDLGLRDTDTVADRPVAVLARQVLRIGRSGHRNGIR
jgi:hypothetical protein